MRTIIILSRLQMYMNVWTVTSKVTNILAILTLYLFWWIPVRLNDMSLNKDSGNVDGQTGLHIL